MSTYIQQRAWRWLAISATGAALAALVRRLVGRGRVHARPAASRPSEDTAAEAALAGGAMNNEGGPARNV
jgi:hypothetical protein